MKWIGISGSWRYSTPELEKDVRREVSRVLKAGNGIVTGGALGVDYLATEVTLAANPGCERLKIILPVKLDLYAAHYRKRALEGVIVPETAERLITQLTTVRERNPAAIIDDFPGAVIDKETYYARNSIIVDASDELLAFQVNGSEGTGDAINKAHSAGKAVTLFSYQVEPGRA